MRRYPEFHIVDVFAETRYSGNQLAVFRHAEHLTPQQMQLLAREVNFSETTFILEESPTAGVFPVRIFTPLTEIPFAGHPTLGTAFVVQQTVLQKPVPQVTLALPVGLIPVAFEYEAQSPERLWMRQKPPDFGEMVDKELVARALGLTIEEVGEPPPQVVSTGLPFIIAPLTNETALRRARLTREPELLAPLPVKAFLLFCRQPLSPENHLRVRVFAHEYGVPEDPATGSANGCLAAYLVHHALFGSKQIDIRVEQGHEVGRPSLLFLRAAQRGELVTVEVGGRVIPVARGELVVE